MPFCGWLRFNVSARDPTADAQDGTSSLSKFQLPSTILLRFIGPCLFFATITTRFGIITPSTAFIKTWRQMIALRVLLGHLHVGDLPWFELSHQHLVHSQRIATPIRFPTVGRSIYWPLALL